MTDPIKVILSDRGQTHGKFEDNARITDTLRASFRGTPNWGNLRSEQRLALDEIALKVSRILSAGNGYKVPEHWNDIAGYATLGSYATQTFSVPKPGDLVITGLKKEFNDATRVQTTK